MSITKSLFVLKTCRNYINMNNIPLTHLRHYRRECFFEYLYHSCNRGRENIRDVQRDDFELKRDAKGLGYVRVRVVRQSKNHRGDNLTDVDDKDGRMYEIPGKLFIGNR